MTLPDPPPRRYAWPVPRRAALLLLALLGACTPEPTPLGVATDLGPSLARPLLNAFAAEHGAAVETTNDAHAAVLWQRDPTAILRLAAAGDLAPLPTAALGDRPPLLVDGERRWAASAATARVLLRDPAAQPLPDVGRVLDLARPELASRLVLADPSRGSALWHAAALFGRLGDERGAAFFRALRDGGALVVESEEAVAAAVTSGTRPLALLDSDRAHAAQAERRELVILVPDQGEGMSGAFALPWPVAVRAGADPLATTLAGYLLAPAQAFQLALSANAYVAVGGETPPGLIDVGRLRLMEVSYPELLARLESVRTALAR